MTDRESGCCWIATTQQQAEELALILTAAGIPSSVEQTARGWALVVAWRDEERAAQELAAFHRETRPTVDAASQEHEYGRTYAGYLVALCLVAFHVVTGPRGGEVRWFDVGSAAADRIVDGEVWRAITALTLHADVPHLVGNAVSCAVFLTAVCRQLGPGIGSWLVLLAGAVGNAINAIAHGPGHISVGASTALFGAIGILAGLQFSRRRRRLDRQARAWVPIAAGVALLVMLGTGKNADVGAHLFGFVVGAPLGIAAALPFQRTPGPAVQWLLALLAVATVVGCWLTALR